MVLKIFDDLREYALNPMITLTKKGTSSPDFMNSSGL